MQPQIGLAIRARPRYHLTSPYITLKRERVSPFSFLLGSPARKVRRVHGRTREEGEKERAAREGDRSAAIYNAAGMTRREQLDVAGCSCRRLRHQSYFATLISLGGVSSSPVPVCLPARPTKGPRRPPSSVLPPPPSSSRSPFGHLCTRQPRVPNAAVSPRCRTIRRLKRKRSRCISKRVADRGIH